MFAMFLYAHDLNQGERHMSSTTIILWIGAAIMTIGLLSFLYLTLKAPPEN